MEKYSNQELKVLYSECVKAASSEKPNEFRSVLSLYNSVFGKEYGHLHEYMARELMTLIEKEMAKRFYEQQ